MNSLGDYREANGEWDYSEIQRLRDYILRVEVPCEVRWAGVLKPGSLAAAGHVLIVISEALGARIKMRMFDDPQHALRWIRQRGGLEIAASFSAAASSSRPATSRASQSMRSSTRRIRL